MGRIVLCWRQPLCPIHPFELRIKMAQPPQLNLGQLGRAPSLQKLRAHCESSQGHTVAAPQPSFSLSPVLLPSHSCRGWSPELCLISFLSTNLHLRVCYLGKPTVTLPHCHLLPEYLTLSFSHTCSWAACLQLFLLSLCLSLSPLTLLLAIAWNSMLSPSRNPSRKFYVGQEPFPLLSCFYSLQYHPHQATKIYLNYWSTPGNWMVSPLNLTNSGVQRREAKNVKPIIGGPLWIHSRSLLCS